MSARIVGLVGGTGPESTVDYYKQIIARWREQHPGSYPTMVITSIDLDSMIPLVRAGEQAYIHDKYVSELIPGAFLPETREGLMAIVRRVIAADGADAVILGGTELPLILTEPDVDGVPFVDTTAVHVREIVAELAR